MQFEQFATVVLVEPLTWALSGLLDRGRWSAAPTNRTAPGGRSAAATPTSCREARAIAVCLALPVVEIEQHRFALGDGAEQRAKVAENIRADNAVLVLAEHIPLARSLGFIHAEMIEPEVGHDFLQLPFAQHGAPRARFVPRW